MSAWGDLQGCIPVSLIEFTSTGKHPHRGPLSPFSPRPNWTMFYYGYVVGCGGEPS